MIPRVWAPHARDVVLVTGGERRACARADDGWATAPADLPAGTRYAWSLDGADPLPDPRSPLQPEGVHGPSAVVDHAAFPWTDQRWRGAPLRGGTVYELHVGTFTAEGTFDAAIAHLGHLAELGITHVELLPVHAFPGRWGWGYDGVLWYAVHAPYGGPDGLKRFVDAAHGHGLAVLLDVVYNHVGPEGNYLDRYGPYFTDTHHTPWGPALNLDGEGSTEVRAHVIGTLRHWFVHHHVDGLRIDATHALKDDSALPLLEELAREADVLSAHVCRPLSLVAEDDRRDVRLVTAREAGGTGLDAMWADDLHHAVHALLTGERQGYYADFGAGTTLAKALRDAQVLDGVVVPRRGAVVGRPAGATPRDRFVVCSQNHDQVGNRARGDRLVHLAGPDKARLAAALVLLSAATPLLFQGEEWAATSPFPFFADFEDPALRTAVSEGRRREFAAFGWDPEDIPDPSDPATRDLAVLRWDELADAPHAGMLAWYRALLALRRAHPDLTDPRPERTDAWCAGDVLHLRRGALHIVAVLADEAVRVAVPDGHGVLLSSGEGDEVPGWGVRVTGP